MSRSKRLQPCAAAPAAPADSPAPPPTRFERLPVVPAGLTLALLTFALMPRVHSNPRMLFAFVGIAAALGLWTLLLWTGVKRWGQTFRIEGVKPLKTHYIQALVQSSFYTIWGWTWPNVYEEIPLFFAQLVFLYTVDGLVSWSRGRTWRLGCGPLPIILSTNVFIWFKDDWYVFQFLMIAVGALAKEFVKWERDGRKSHIFNPSALSLSIVSVVLIATGTSEITWAGRIADTVSQIPQVYVIIFGLGLVVQYFFSTTLMTLAAVVMIWALNTAYTASTTTPFFIFSNIPAPIFLGLHLLVTDPATSPRTGLGKLIFGGLYGLGAFAFYGILVHLDSLSVYDKLLPVPLLNLGVRVIDGFVRNVKSIPWLQVLTGQGSRGLNVLHMGAWVVVFTTMLTTSYVQGKHEGGTIEFWKRKLAEGRPGAGKALVEVLKSQSRDNYAPAWNELGILYLQGQLVARDPVVAARCFTRACKLGSIPASANIAAQFLGNPSAKSARVIELAFDRLEKECAGDTDPVFYQLVGFAYETGRARPRDLERARMYYEKGCAKKNREACNALSRLSASGPPPETR